MRSLDTFASLNAGPDELRWLVTASFVLVGAGMVIGILGHLTQLTVVVGTGIAMVFAGAVCFVFAVGQFG
jgi:hypothetical protein